MPLLNPVHIGPILAICAQHPELDDLQDKIEQVRYEVGDNMQSNDNVLFLKDCGILETVRGGLRLTEGGRQDIEQLFAAGVFDGRRWLKVLFREADPDKPGRYFIHHAMRFLEENGPQADKNAFRRGFTQYLTQLPEISEYLGRKGLAQDAWMFSGASADRVVRSLRIWNALAEGANDLRLALKTDDLREGNVDDSLDLDDFWARLMIAYQRLSYRYPDKDLFPIWQVREATQDVHPLSRERFYELLSEAIGDTEIRPSIILYRGAGEDDRKEFLETRTGGTTDLYYLIKLKV